MFQQEPAVECLQLICRAAQGEMCTCLFSWGGKTSPPSQWRLEVLTPLPGRAPLATSPGTCRCFPSPLPPSSLSPGVLSPPGLLSPVLPPHRCQPDLPVLPPQPCCRSKEVFEYCFPPKRGNLNSCLSLSGEGMGAMRGLRLGGDAILATL